MSDKADKRKPALERIARIMGSSTFRDSGGGGKGSDCDPDVIMKGALGYVHTYGGDLASMALETFYSGTLQYEARLRHLWLAEFKDATEGAQDRHAFMRIGCALAIRQFAGSKYSRGDMGEWAWLLRVRRDRLERYVGDVTSWLNEALATGERLFRDQIRGRADHALTGRPNGVRIAASKVAAAS